jgi:hypothetical protein
MWGVILRVFTRFEAVLGLKIDGTKTTEIIVYW